MKSEQEIKWRKLDNTAKIFPIISNKKFSSIFCLSAVLKQEIKPELLQKAVEKALETFKGYQVKLRRGFFWYYFETNTKKPIIQKENTYPCKFIPKNENNHYLFRVTYYENKINLEMFHSITDGNGALSFFKLILYHYISLKKYHCFYTVKKEDCLSHENLTTEDSYVKNYDKHFKHHIHLSSAYLIKGRNLPLFATSVVHIHLPVKDLLNYCKKHNATITQYFTAKLIYAIYQTKIKNKNSNSTQGTKKRRKKQKKIKIYIPVNLKKFFDSSTITNFFSYISVEANYKEETFDNFEKVLSYVIQDFQKNLTKNQLSNKISHNVSTEKNILIRLIPLPIKKYSVKLGYLKASTHHTTTISNLGTIQLKKDFADEVENFYFFLSPSQSEKMKYSICSYQDILTFTYHSSLADTSVITYLIRSLTEENQEILVKTNNVHENLLPYEKKDLKLYPTIQNIKKSHFIITLLASLSILASFICILVNMLTTPHIYWSLICVTGILYVWITTLYAIKKNQNIASHVLLQTFCATILTYIIDLSTHYKGWAIHFALPIIIIAANTTMITLLIVTRKKYFKYMIYQIILTLYSTLPILLLNLHLTHNVIFTFIASLVAFLSFFLTIVLCGHGFNEEIKRRFHF